MKNAFITFYEHYEKSNTIELTNGFTFIGHLIEGDHFFIKRDYNNEELLDRLSGYDKIFISIVFWDQFSAILPIVDKRWVLGGRFFYNIPEDHWKRLVDPTQIHTMSFETYLNQPDSNIINSYWDDWIKSHSPVVFKYCAICNTECYWKKCKFCFVSHVKKLDYNVHKNIVGIYNQLPEYDFHSVVTLALGSISPKILEELIVETQKNPKKRVLLKFMGIRGDDCFLNIFEQAFDLSCFSFHFGLETFSQTASDVLCKGINTKIMLHLMKMAIDKGAYVNTLVMSRLPFMNKEIFSESIESIDWIKNNIKPKSKFSIYDAYNIEWPSEEVAGEFGEYDIVVDNDMKDGYTRYSKKIISRLSDEKSDMCFEIIEELREYGYKIS